MNRNIRAVALALLVAGLLYAVANQYLPGLGIPWLGASAAPATVDIVVAGADISPLQPLTIHLLRRETVSLDTYQALGPHPLTVADRPLLDGAVARVPLAAGQPILLGQIYGPHVPTVGRVEALPINDALYAIQAPYLSTPTFGLGPGTWVDVTATYKATPGKTMVGTNGVITDADDLASSTLAETTLETKVQVTDVRLSPQPAVTIAIPRTDVRAFDFFKRIATFSFAEVSPNAPHLSLPSLSAAQIRQIYGPAALPSAPAPVSLPRHTQRRPGHR